MSGNGNQVPLAPNQRGPGPYPRASTPHRGECYHPGGGAGAAYMTGGTSGAPQSAQTGMRTASAPQPATSQSPQDMQNNSMTSHNFAQQSPINNQPRQYTNFSGFRTTQHGSRPSSHPRQQNYLSGGNPANPSPSVMYHQSLMFPTSHMGATHMPQSYQQPRAQQYIQYIHPYMNYNNSPNHTTPYYGYQSQQMPTQTMPPNNNATRTNPSPHVTQPNAAPTPPTTNIPPHIQSTQNNHRPLPGLRGNKRHRIPIINPDTDQDVLVEMYSNDNVSSGDGVENHTERNHIIEDFARRVYEAASESSPANTNNMKNHVTGKSIEPPKTMSPPTNTVQTSHNSIPIVDIGKSDILPVNETVSLGPEVAATENEETPVVSAISDSPVIVPKVPVNKKPVKNEPSVVVDNSKNVPSNKQKAIKNKPFVPQSDEDKAIESTSVVTSAPTGPMAPLPQRIREPRDRRKSMESVSVEESSENITVNGPAVITTTATANSIGTLLDLASELNRERKNLMLPNKSIQVKQLIESTGGVDSKGNNALTATDLLASIDAVSCKPITDCIRREARSYTKKASAAQTILDQCLNCNKQNNFDGRIIDYYPKNIATDAGIKAVENAKEIVNHIEDIKNEDEVKNVINLNATDESPMSDDATTPTLTTDEEPPKENMSNNVTGDKTVENSAKPTMPAIPTVVVPKYRYAEGHWSPQNPNGKKRYDLSLLKQIKDDALSNNKPNIPRLEQLKVARSQHIPDYISLHNFAASRPTSDALFPNFLKPQHSGSKNLLRVDPKKDMRSSLSGMKMNQMSSGSSGSMKQNVIHLSLREDVKLNETENAWKPARFKKSNLSEDEAKTQEVYKRFRGILNKLTPQKFDQLMERVRLLEIDTQKRLEGVIDLVFEKAIDEPNFSKAYAAMCNKLSKLKVPAENAPDQCVNFRALIINKCQMQFVTKKVDENVEKLEKEMNDCADPIKKKELFLLLQEENRRLRMRSVGNVRFIGELFKLKMLTSKIMMYCMNYLIEKLEEEKLECLCKLLTTIGEQVEMEIKDRLDEIFKKMQQIVDQKSNKISSRVRFMLQDVIELRKRHWVTKSVVDLQPKMMDQIQKEAEQQHRQTELLNSLGGFRGNRDDGSRGKRDSRRTNQNALFENTNNWKTTRINYPIDTSKLKAGSHKTLDNIKLVKLAPMKTHWGSGSGTKTTTTSSFLSFTSTPSTVNKFSVLDSTTSDSLPVRATSSSGSRSMGVPMPEPSTPAPTPAPLPTPSTTSELPQTPLSDQKVALVKNLVDQALVSPDKDDLAEEIKLSFEPHHHASVVTNILNVALEKPAKEVDLIAKLLLRLVQSNVISASNLLWGLTEVFEIAPDLYIDIPMLYSSISKLIVTQMESKHVTLTQILQISDSIISANQGHLLLRCLLKDLKISMGSSYVKTKWQDSGLQFKQWMKEDQVEKFLTDNDLQFLEGGAKPMDEVTKVVSPSEAQSKLLKLMVADENCECIRGWVQSNVGKSASEDWFMKSLIQAICEYALFGAEPQSIPHFNQDRMNKYSELIHEFGESKDSREASCLFGIQQLIHHLEHPQGITLEIFQYLHEQYIITVEGFTAWENSEKEPEGKGVMMKALTSFFTSIKEVDNEDSFSED